MPNWQYKSVYLRIHPQTRDAAPKPGKLVVASPAMIEPLVAGQEQRLLSDYLDHQGTKGWELFSILPDHSGDRGPCFVFRRIAASVQPVAEQPARAEAQPPTPDQATAGLKPPPGVTQPVAQPPAPAPAAPAPAANPAPQPSPARPPMPSAPLAQPAVAPPLPGASPAPPPPRGSAPIAAGTAAAAPAVAVPAAPHQPAPPVRAPMPSHPAASAPAGPPPLPAPAANVPVQPQAVAPVPQAAAAAAAPAAAAPAAVPPPMPLAARGSAPSRGSSPNAAHPAAQQAPVIVPPLAPPNPAAVKQPAAQPAAPDYTAILLQAIDLAARGNPQGWAEMTLVSRTCAQSGLSQDQLYEFLEYLAVNRVVEWSPSPQTPKRGGWVRRAR